MTFVSSTLRQASSVRAISELPGDHRANCAPRSDEAPSLRSSMKTSRSTISTSLATCTAVKGLSPVIMTHCAFASFTRKFEERKKRSALDETHR